MTREKQANNIEYHYLWVFGMCGIIAMALYMTASILGDALRPGYDAIRDSVSELTEAGAPNKQFLDTMIGTYHALIALVFGLINIPLVQNQSDYIGLGERVSILVIFQWYVVIGMRLIRLSGTTPKAQ